MDVFKLLEKDHEKVKGLFKKLVETSDGAQKTRENLFKELATELTVHAKVEETIVYPRLKEVGELSEQIEEAVDEHHEAESLLEELAGMETTDKEWLAKLQELQEAVEHHVKEEEQQLFPEARDFIDDDEAMELAKTVEEEKKEMLKGSHGAAKEAFSRLGL